MTIQAKHKTQSKYHPEILYVINGSRSGNSKSAATLARDFAVFNGMKSELIDMQDFASEDISSLKNILIAVSTHGEGDPPIAAENLLLHLQKSEANLMGNANFSVLALGDSSYRHFCKTGHDFQDQLLRLGANKTHDLMECDIDFEENAKTWVEDAVNVFTKILPVDKKKKKAKFVFDLSNPDDELAHTYKAKVLENRILNSDSKSHKLMHIRLSLKNSGINYTPGDTIGIYSSNSRRVVDKIIKILNFDSTHLIESKNKKKMLKQALIDDYELTLLTPVVVKKYAEFGNDSNLNNLLETSDLLDKYCESKDFIDLVYDYPISLNASNLASILRKLPSRLYSIASSQKEYPDEVHLMVRLIDFEQNDRRYEGVCSSYLSTRIEDGESISIYHEANEKFHLPKKDIPIIMISAGTGLAPFRAFLQEREKLKSSAKNWLIFGERNKSTDFYFQQEIEEYQKSGLLTRLNTAFSRDQKEKSYVGDKMLENSHELFKWLESGAVIYLCGNKYKLAKSVRTTLVQIIQKEGNLSLKEATDYMTKMKVNKRFLEDVY